MFAPCMVHSQRVTYAVFFVFQQTLAGRGLTLASEFLTPEEMVSFFLLLLTHTSHNKLSFWGMGGILETLSVFPSVLVSVCSNEFHLNVL